MLKNDGQENPNTTVSANATQETNIYELLGRPLNCLQRVTVRYENDYKEEIPKIVFLLTTFFRVNKQHFEKQGLFRVNGDRSIIEELSIHLQLGDFSILNRFVEKPNEVANFLKEILRELTAPVCPFANYTSFRDLPKNLTPQQKLSEIVTLLRDLPELNRATLLYLARFFHEVSTHSE